MNKTMQSEMLEQKLAELFGKRNCTPYKKPCTGKYRGYYDYGLAFDDGTSIFISLGREYYLRNLSEKVEMYQYFHDNKEHLTRRTMEVIERDNKQAVQLGLKPIEFVRLSLETNVDSFNPFWIVLVYRQNGEQFRHADTIFYYACLGVGLNDEKSVDAYFDKLVDRPDSRLGRLDQLGQQDFNAILLGYLHK